MSDREITLDAWGKNDVTVTVVQGEVKARKLRLLLRYNGGPLNLTGHTVSIYYEKPDGKIIYNPCEIDNAAQGSAYVTLTAQMSAVAGKMRDVEIHVSGGETLLKITGLQIEVLSSDFERSLLSADELQAFQEALQNIADIDNIRSTANQAKQGVEAAVPLAQKGEALGVATLTAAKKLAQMPTAADVRAVPTSRTVNGKALTADVVLGYADVKAVPAVRKVNNKPLATDITLTPADVGAVPVARTVNGKRLAGDINLTAADVGAHPVAWMPTLQQMGIEIDTWQPILTVNGQTSEAQYRMREGNYLKIGSYVRVSGMISLSKKAAAGSGTGTINITGLPYKISNYNSASGLASLDGITEGGAGGFFLRPAPSVGGASVTTVTLYRPTATGGDSNSLASLLKDTSSLWIDISYFTS